MEVNSEKRKGSVSDLRNILTASGVSYVAQLNWNVSSGLHETAIRDPLLFFLFVMRDSCLKSIQIPFIPSMRMEHN